MLQTNVAACCTSSETLCSTGYYEATRKTELILCKNAVQDCFGDAITIFISYYKIKFRGKLRVRTVIILGQQS